jgi:hypothetical protein
MSLSHIKYSTSDEQIEQAEPSGLPKLSHALNMKDLFAPCIEDEGSRGFPSDLLTNQIVHAHA